MHRLENRVERLERETGGKPVLVMICRVDETKEECWARQEGGKPFPSPGEFEPQVFLHIE
jgi:hypothetical protein